MAAPAAYDLIGRRGLRSEHRRNLSTLRTWITDPCSDDPVPTTRTLSVDEPATSGGADLPDGENRDSAPEDEKRELHEIVDQEDILRRWNSRHSNSSGSIRVPYCRPTKRHRRPASTCMPSSTEKSRSPAERSFWSRAGSPCRFRSDGKPRFVRGAAWPVVTGFQFPTPLHAALWGSQQLRTDGGIAVFAYLRVGNMTEQWTV